jgi:hypothetical protein
MAVLGGNAVLYGGTGAQRFGDTWTFNGTSWTHVTDAGPAARSLHSMATLNGKVVLFGGSLDGGLQAGARIMNDTWTFDGATWTQLFPAISPSARAEHGMAAVNGKVVLFGGFNSTGSQFNETWTFDGTNWAQLSPTMSPLGADVYDVFTPFGGGAVLYNGGNTTSLFVGSNWTSIPASPQPARDRGAIASLGGNALLFGGLSGGVLNDTWSFDGTTWKQLGPSTPPPARYAHAMVTIP